MLKFEFWENELTGEIHYYNEDKPLAEQGTIICIGWDDNKEDRDRQIFWLKEIVSALNYKHSRI
jgi:hypothetical protein